MIYVVTHPMNEVRVRNMIDHGRQEVVNPTVALSGYMPVTATVEVDPLMEGDRWIVVPEEQAAYYKQARRWVSPAQAAIAAAMIHKHDMDMAAAREAAERRFPAKLPEHLRREWEIFNLTRGMYF